MLSRLTRPAALASVALCSLALLTACGDSDSSSEKEASGFDAVSISGSFGELPTFDWKAALKPGKTESEVLEEGDGAVLEDGDQVVINIAVSDDFSQEVAIDTYGDENSGAVLTVGEKAEPQQAIDLFTQLVGEQVKAGMKVGTRIAVTADVKKEFGQTALALNTVNIGNEDGVAIVADLEAVPLDGPEGKSQPAPQWAPKLSMTKGEPSNLDSSSQPAPDPKAKTIEKALLTQGTGPVVKKGDTIVVDYLGQVYDAAKPFDLSYDDDAPATFTIGTGNVVKGWDQGLVGVKVGSRVLLRIPPALGYGKDGHGKEIPGGATLYFVVDILAAA